MLKKEIISLLLCAGLLLAAAPPKACAQTPAQSAHTRSGQGSSDVTATPGPGLRAAFAEVMARDTAGTSLGAGIKRLERESLNAQPASGYSKKEKILVISIVVGLVVLAVVLAAKTGKGGHTFCDIDPTDPDCLLP